MGIKHTDSPSFPPREIPSIVYVDPAGVRKPIRRVTYNGVQIWPSWAWTDDFNRSTLGANWTITNGGAAVVMLDSKAVRRSAVSGSTDIYTTVDRAPADNFTLEAGVYSVQDPAQISAVLFGSPAQYVYAEVSRNSWTLGIYNGSTWTILASGGSTGLAAGNTIVLSRVGTSISLEVGGVLLATRTQAAGVAMGPGKRRLGLSVRVDKPFWGTFYSPDIDYIRVK